MGMDSSESLEGTGGLTCTVTSGYDKIMCSRCPLECIGVSHSVEAAEAWAFCHHSGYFGVPHLAHTAKSAESLQEKQASVVCNLSARRWEDYSASLT